MPSGLASPRCLGVHPSAPSELAWLVDLLVQSAPYAEPALAELDQSLLSGISAMRPRLRLRYQSLWRDGVSGCPELVPLAHALGCLNDGDLARFFEALSARAVGTWPRFELLSEPAAVREPIARRIERLHSERPVRLRYRELMDDVWQLAQSEWTRRGLAFAEQSCERWRLKIASGLAIEDLVEPRHPLTRSEELGLDTLFEHRSGYVLSPLYFCMSGGHVVDVADHVHIGVSASELQPIRRARDAQYVADRLKVLAEPTRVRILIQLLSSPIGVMELSRALRISQATVSGHVKMLRDAGLIQPRRLRSRDVFTASQKRIERQLEDARATLARWD